MLYTILDIETTGFNRINDEMLEFGYIQVNKNLDIIRHGVYYFYKDGWRVNTPAQSVHGLTEGFLKNYAGDFDDNLVRIYSLLERGIVIGKNSNAFDIPFIQSFFKKYLEPLTPINIYGTLDLQDYYKNRFRTWYQEQHGVATRKSGTLEELVHMIGYTDAEIERRFKEKFPNEGRAGAHSALYDVFMTYLLTEHAIKTYGMRI